MDERACAICVCELTHRRIHDAQRSFFNNDELLRMIDDDDILSILKVK